MNPFMSDSFNLHDLSLMTEAIGLYVKNDSRMMYSALEIMEVGKEPKCRKCLLSNGAVRNERAKQPKQQHRNRKHC